MKKIFQKKSIRRSVLLVVLSSILASVLILVIYFLFFQYRPDQPLRVQMIHPNNYGWGGAEGAIEEKDAQEILVNYLINSGEVEERSRGQIEVDEITNNRLWKNNEMQLFIVRFAFTNCLAIFKSGEFVDLLAGVGGMFEHMFYIFISDLNGNNKYDICIQMSRGSGIVDDYIIVYDTSTYTTYFLEDFGALGYYNASVDMFSNSIYIHYTGAYTADGWDRITLGELRIVDETLVIE